MEKTFEQHLNTIKDVHGGSEVRTSIYESLKHIAEEKFNIPDDKAEEFVHSWLDEHPEAVTGATVTVDKNGIMDIS